MAQVSILSFEIKPAVAQVPAPQPLWSYETGWDVSSITISSDGSYVAAGERGMGWGVKVYLFSRDSSTPLWSCGGGYRDAWSVAISSDGSYIAAGDEDGNVYLFSRDSSIPLWSYTTGAFLIPVAISSDGSYIAAGGRGVYLFSRDSSIPLWSYDVLSSIDSVAISSDGSYIAAGNWDDKIYLFSRVSSTPLWSYATSEIGGFSGIGSYRGDPDVESVAISSDGSYIAAGDRDGKIYLFTSKVSTTLTVSPPSFTHLPKGSIELTATLKDYAGNPLPNRIIRWEVSAGILAERSDITDLQGKVTVTYTAPNYETLVTITASFDGDDQYRASGGSSTGIIEKKSTTLTLNLPPENDGRYVIFTGRLAENDTNAGLSGLAIKIVAHYPGLFPTTLATETTDEDGEFSIQWEAERISPMVNAVEVVAEFEGTSLFKPSQYPITGGYPIRVEPELQFFDYKIVIVPTTDVVKEGDSITYYIVVESKNNFKHDPMIRMPNVDLQIGSLPSDVCSLDPMSPQLLTWYIVKSVPAGVSALGIDSANLATGTHQFSISGESRGVSHGSSGTLEVVSLSPAAAKIITYDVHSKLVDPTYRFNAASVIALKAGIQDPVLYALERGKGYIGAIMGGEEPVEIFISEVWEIIEDRIIPLAGAVEEMHVAIGLLESANTDKKTDVDYIIGELRRIPSLIKEGDEEEIDWVALSILPSVREWRKKAQGLTYKSKDVRETVITSLHNLENLLMGELGLEPDEDTTVGAYITIKANVPREEVYDPEVKIETVAKPGKIVVKVSSDKPESKTIIINIDNTTLSFTDKNEVLVLFNGKEIGEADNYDDVFDPTDENVPEYLVKLGARGTLILVSIPSFSTHTIEIMQQTPAVIPTPTNWPLIGGIIAAVVIIVAAAVIHKRR